MRREYNWESYELMWWLNIYELEEDSEELEVINFTSERISNQTAITM